MIRIETLNGPEVGRVLELEDGVHVLGRRAPSDCLLDNRTVSGRHLELQVSVEGVRFRDLGSTNGTWSGGLKVEEGEWFPGSELRLGDLRLRLLDTEDAPSLGEGDAASGSAAGDAEIHRRALAAMDRTGGRKGLWLALLFLLGAGAGAGWSWSHRTPPEEGPGVVLGTPGGASGGAAEVLDAIEGLGDLSPDSLDSWQFTGGAQAAEGSLRTSGKDVARAALAPRFPLDGSLLRFRAEVQGVHVWPLVSFGTEGAERAAASWAAPDLAAGPADLLLPGDAAWFQLELRIEGSGSLRDLRVESADGQLRTSAADGGRQVQVSGANLRVLSGREALCTVRGGGGIWTPSTSGANFQPGPGPGAWLELALPSGDSQLLILTADGPVEALPGSRIQAATGLLLRGPSRWQVDFGTPLACSIRGGWLRFQPSAPLSLSWDLSQALAEAARLDLVIRRSAREKDTAALLAATSTLVSRYPLDPEQVARALQLRDTAIAEGRRAEADLEREVAEAVFLGAVDEMRRVADRAAALAASLPGTAVAGDALRLVAVLQNEESKSEALLRQREREFQARLRNALKPVYPFLASWIAREDRS